MLVNMLSGKLLNDGILPLPFLITAIICSSVTLDCHSDVVRSRALTIGDSGPSPLPRLPWQLEHCFTQVTSTSGLRLEGAEYVGALPGWRLRCCACLASPWLW